MSLTARLGSAALALALPVAALPAAERSAPPRLSSARADALTEAEREAVVAWAMARPEVKSAVADHRTRLLRVWSDVAKGESGSYRRAVMVLRDYDAGTALEVSTNLTTGSIETRALVGIQPSREEIEEGMAIVRSDPALAAFVANPKLELAGGFHNRSRYPADPCSREICLDFAFMKPNYQGPARYVIVNLTRRVVANRDFRARPGEAPPRMTKKVAP
jgi:hypothetical protein